jgi:hypothetical protein
MPNDEDLKRRYEQETFIGRSKRARMRQPSLKNAVKDAYDQAVREKGGAAAGEVKAYRVLDIWAVGTNPLSEYIVALGPDS